MAIREAWALRRAELIEQAETLAEAIRQQAAGGGGPAPLDQTLASALEETLVRRFDRAHGGFGRAPKFPSPSNLFFLLDRARQGRTEARDMLVVTLERMARGGIHDQIGGGFHRYSTDAEWLVPHFEKMLYDNASLALLYAEADAFAPEEGFARVARATLNFVLREMTGPEGGFLSAIDAQTHGHEGAYYTWTADELKAALEPDAHASLASLYGFGGRPNFESDRYVLHLPQPVEDATLVRAEPARATLLAARSRRERPLTDDKLLADWNGLMIGAMAVASVRLGELRYREAAERAASLVLDQLRDAPSGERRHVFRLGRAKVPALLDDYAFLIDGLLQLQGATQDERWLEEARRLQEEQDRRLWDDAAGGYFNAGEDPRLLVRSKAAHDGAVASANGVAALNLITLAERTGEAGYRSRAERLLRAFSRVVTELPIAHVTLVRAILAFGPVVAAPAIRAPAPAPMASMAEDVVTVRATLDRTAAGDWKPFQLELTIRDGWHVNANPPLLRFLIATQVRSGESQVRKVRYPKADRYEGRVTIEGEIEAGAGAPSLSLTYQPCDEEKCLTAVTRQIVLR
jgi:hypothetical protein